MDKFEKEIGKKEPGYEYRFVKEEKVDKWRSKGFELVDEYGLKGLVCMRRKINTK